MDAAASPQILIADDQTHVLETLTILLEDEGFSVAAVSGIGEIIPALTRRHFDLLLMDMNFHKDTTSGQDGLDLLARVAALDPTLPVVVMTAWGNVELVVKAMELGSRDFIEKPWDNHRLLSVLKNQIELGREKRCNRLLNAFASKPGTSSPLIAESEAMQAVLDMIERVAGSDANILLTGESGTGKNLLAQYIHDRSPLAGRPFVRCNLGTMAESVFESELFGHVKGAFTDARADRVGRFAMADGGSLFLDEIANTPMSLQSKLLQVIETGEFEVLGSSQTETVDVRVICASNVDFAEEIKAGRFRQDLFFRINTVNIDIPPLRARPADIPPLVRHLLAHFGRKYRRPSLGLSAAAEDAIMRYAWPGNVRELAHSIEKAVLLCRGQCIEAPDLGLGAGGGNPAVEQMTLVQAERYLIEKAMERYRGNVSEVADHLGLTRGACYRRLAKFGLKSDSGDTDE